LVYGAQFGEDSAKIAQLLEEQGLKNRTPGLVIAKVARQKGGIKLKDVIEAIHWVASQKVDIVNMSVGFTGEASQFADLKKALEAHPDIIFVCAAGNYGPLRKVYPAAFGLPNIEAVAEASPTSGKGDIIAPNMFKPVSPKRHAESLQQKEFEGGLVLAQQGKNDEAKKIFLSITKTPGHAFASIAWIQLARYEAVEGNEAAALPLLVKAEETAASNPLLIAEIFDVKGSILFNQKDFAGAEKSLRRSTESDSSNPKTHFLLGVTCLQLKKFRSALAQFEIIDRLNHDYPELQELLVPMREAEKAGKLPPE
jgi:tetratricopeptide (TPR) repeat protein